MVKPTGKRGRGKNVSKSEGVGVGAVLNQEDDQSSSQKLVDDVLNTDLADDGEGKNVVLNSVTTAAIIEKLVNPSRKRGASKIVASSSACDHNEPGGRRLSTWTKKCLTCPPSEEKDAINKEKPPRQKKGDVKRNVGVKKPVVMTAPHVSPNKGAPAVVPQGPLAAADEDDFVEKEPRNKRGRKDVTVEYSRAGKKGPQPLVLVEPPTLEPPLAQNARTEPPALEPPLAQNARTEPHALDTPSSSECKG